MHLCPFLFPYMKRLGAYCFTVVHACGLNLIKSSIHSTICLNPYYIPWTTQFIMHWTILKKLSQAVCHFCRKFSIMCMFEIIRHVNCTQPSPCSSAGSVEDMRIGGRWFEPPARQIFSLRNDDSHCDSIHSSLNAVHCFDNGYLEKQPVACKVCCAKYWLE